MNVDRKNQIIRIAAMLFHKNGYDGVSMRDLAESLDIKASSLYNHISSKQEILALVVMDMAEGFSTHIDRVFSKKGSAVQKLEEVIRMHVEVTTDSTDALACMNNEWRHLAPLNREEFVKMRDGYEEKFRMIVRQGMASGEIDERDLDILVFSILSTLRTLYIWYAKNKGRDGDALKTDVVQTLLFGISKR